jgi:hypothetical protein
MKVARYWPPRLRSRTDPPVPRTTRTRLSALVLTAFALTAPLTACATGSARSHPAVPVPATAGARQARPPIPAGYHLIGGQAAGVMLAVPDAWVAIDFTRQSVADALKRVRLSGISDAALRRMMEALHSARELYAVDPASVNTDQGFATNISAYCQQSGTTETGSSAYAYLLSATAVADYVSHAHQVSAFKAVIGAIPGLRITTALDRSGTLTATTLAAAPKPDRACFITYTDAHPRSSSAVLATVMPTIRFT